MEKTDQEPVDRVYDFFMNKTIFITGGTGYVGKVLIERMLRMLDVKKIYILVRTKKDQNPQSRLKTLFASPLFDKVRQQKGDDILLKCQVISGDVTLDNFGISPCDYLLLQKEVEMVIHSAATVRFDEPLKTAVKINVKGVQTALQLAKEMEKLQLFVHISTAFCHPEEKTLYEKFYKTNMKPEQVIQMMDWLSDEQVEKMTPEFLRGVPNSYTFTKSLGEDLVHSEINNLPIIVVRPSIVVPIWKEPIPGWTDNINGPMGLMVGAGKGVVRTMYGDKHASADFIPVDVCADAIFALATYSVINGIPGRIFNFTSSNEVKMSWGHILDLGKSLSVKLPLGIMLWRPGGGMRSSRILHWWALVVYQFIPALIVDALLSCFGYKPFLWNIQRRIMNGMQVFEYYTNNEWIFNNDNSVQARKWLNSKEWATYTVSAVGFDESVYMENAIRAARKYMFKEPEESLPRTRRIMTFMIWLDRICNVLIKVLLAYLFYKYIFLYFYSRH